MPKHTVHQQIVAALLARGKQELQDIRLLKYRKFTRQFRGERSSEGALLKAGIEAFWFLPKNGALRTGKNSTSSRRVKSSVAIALRAEGLAMLKVKA